MLFSPQIPLPLEPPREARFEGFVAGSNQPVVDALRNLCDDPSTSVYLHGAAGVGKTHLLHAVCHLARDRGLTAFYAALARLELEHATGLAGTGGLDFVCLDDLDEVAGRAEWEECLFHLFNRLKERGGKLVVTSSVALRALPPGLPDLRSRLASGLRLQLQPLDEGGKREVLGRYAESRGVDLPEEVARYLLRRGHRNLGRLVASVDQLQRAALAAKRRITVPLAREILHR